MKRALPWDEQVDEVSSDSGLSSSSSSASDSQELNLNDRFAPYQSSAPPVTTVRQPVNEISSSQGTSTGLGFLGT